MHQQNLIVAICILSLLTFHMVPHVRACQDGPTANGQDFYSAFADEVFRCQNDTCDVKGKEFVIVLRYTRTMRIPDAQITITKFTDGHVEASYARLQKPLSAYFPDENDSSNLTPEQAKSLAKNIPVDRHVVRLTDSEWRTILADYKNLRFSPMLDSGLFLDGTCYELWFTAPMQRAHYVLFGTSIEANDKDDQPVQWMKQVYNLLKGR